MNSILRNNSWEIDLGRLPVTAERKAGAFFGLLILLFACVWGGFPVLGMARNGFDLGRGPEQFLFLIFPLIGVGIALYGLHLILHRKSITIDKYFVAVAERGLLGAKAWREQISGYRGVLARTRRVSTKHSSYTLYLVDLKHDDDAKTINLYTARGDRHWRSRWEDYARRLGLPALEEGAGGLVARDVDDLDKSVTELLREGKVTVDQGLLAQGGAQGGVMGVRAEAAGDALVLTRTGPQNPLWGGLIGIAFPAVFIYFAFFTEEMPVIVRIIFGGLGIIFEAAFLSAVIWDRISRRRLVITPDEVLLHSVGPSGPTRGKRLPIAEVEAVEVQRGRKSDRRFALTIATDKKSLRFGLGLPAASLDYIKNAVLAQLAKR